MQRKKGTQAEFNEKQQKAISMLKAKAEEKGRLPIKADFDPGEPGWIKEMLGPWPRALEAAGLKPISKRKLAKAEASFKRNSN